MRGSWGTRGARVRRGTTPRSIAVLVAATLSLLAASGERAGPSPTGPAAPPAKHDPELLPATAARILEEVRRPGASVVLVNVWATWCQPCREEFPDLLKLRRDWTKRGLRLVLVSGDFDTDRPEALRFLAAHGVDFPSFIKDGGDMEFIDGLDPRWSGALPATFLYDSAGRLRRFWEGKADHATLERRVRDVVSGREATSAPGKEKS